MTKILKISEIFNCALKLSRKFSQSCKNYLVLLNFSLDININFYS